MTTTLETPAKTESEATQHVTFYVGGLLWALPISKVQEINRLLEMTSVSQAPAAIRGVINLRGEVVTVIDLRAVLGMKQATFSSKSRNVIIQHEKELIGLLVDEVADTLSIDRSEVRPAPANVNGVEGKYIKGVYTMETEIAVILDVDQTLSS